MKIHDKTIPNLFIVAVISGFLCACGGGGGGSGSDAPPTNIPPTAESQAPAAKINFPIDNAWTTADAMTVTGSATAANSDSITSVTVNGVAAESTDDFANWRVSVPLEAGPNTITVATEDNQGGSDDDASSISINNEVALLTPQDIAVNKANLTALVVDSSLEAVVAVDLL